MGAFSALEIRLIGALVTLVAIIGDTGVLRAPWGGEVRR
jgi:hypothetical protein